MESDVGIHSCKKKNRKKKERTGGREGVSDREKEGQRKRQRGREVNYTHAEIKEPPSKCSPSASFPL